MPFQSSVENFGLNGGLGVIPGPIQSFKVGNDVYLRGQKILIGVNRWGLCGGETSATGTLNPSVTMGTTTPAWVYNPNGLSSTSSNPDYTFPGTPEDGFVLGINGGTSLNNSRGANSGPITGTTSNLSYGRTLRAQWTGTYTDGGNVNLSLTNLYEFDVAGDYIKFTYTISNLSSTALSNVVFIRSLDPDNDQYLGGTYNTFNGVQNGVGNRNMAYGFSAGGNLLAGAPVPAIYFISYDTSIAQGGWGGFQISSAYSPGFSYANNVNSESSQDVAIGITTTIGTIPGNSSFSKYMYIGFWNNTSRPPNPTLPG